jgi:hypothetical protein
MSASVREQRQLVPGGEQPERPELGDARGQGDSDVAAALLDAVVAGEPVVQEQVVLRDHLCAGPGEVQGERGHLPGPGS